MEQMIVGLLLACAATAVYENDFDTYKRCGEALVALTGASPREVAQAISDTFVAAADNVDEAADFTASVMHDIDAL